MHVFSKGRHRCAHWPHFWGIRANDVAGVASVENVVLVVDFAGFFVEQGRKGVCSVVGCSRGRGIQGVYFLDLFAYFG